MSDDCPQKSPMGYCNYQNTNSGSPPQMNSVGFKPVSPTDTRHPSCEASNASLSKRSLSISSTSWGVGFLGKL